MRYRWAAWGDVNAFFGLMLDNVAVMIILFGIVGSADAAKNLTPGSVKFTQEFVVTRMIPGTALGVLVGDLVYTWMAFRLARRSGRAGVTAMPLGLDTPSTFGVAFLILLPALQTGFRLYQDHDRAMNFAWHVALLVLVMIGVFKVACAPLGNLVRRWVPRAGLLGSLAAIALALIAFLPLLLDGIAAMPLVGMPALLIILYTLVAHRELPFKIPGALAAVLLGSALYWLCHATGALGGWKLVPAPDEAAPVRFWQPGQLLALYGLDGAWWGGVFREALGKLPVALPFALATIVGGIDCTESAAAAGDEYDTRTILLTEGVSSVLAGLCGGVIQTTPYIGHPAYKTMGGRAAYTLATALFIGAAGYFGWFTLLFAWLPKAAMFPILVFVGLEITAQSFHATPKHHYAALAFATLPALAYLCKVPLGMVLGPEPPPHTRDMVQTLYCLANGFIVTSLLWGAALAMLLDGRLVRSASYFALAGVCAFFGVIHSPLPSEQIGLPWEVLRLVPDALADAARYQTPFHWAGAYLLLAALLGLLALLSLRSDQTRRRGESASTFPGEKERAPAPPVVP